MFLYSAYSFSLQYTEPDTGDLMLTDPLAAQFQAFDDNIPHEVKDGDTLWGLADFYWPNIKRACGLWWVIADFNDIYDATIALEPGTTLIIPSQRTLIDTIFSGDRSLDVDQAIA